MGEDDTVRRRIMKLLEETDTPLTVNEIVAILDLNLTPTEVYGHLRHIARTVRRSSGGRKALLMKPPVCRSCGYVFSDMTGRPRKPSKCPKCHSEWIEPPAFIIREA